MHTKLICPNAAVYKMYALKARDKLHKREKDDHQDRHSGGDRGGPSRERRQPTTTCREAKVSHAHCLVCVQLYSLSQPVQ